ncbi:oxygenase MpaB family protein [uncultured Cyclobacterium sp.]|uniref:oxygenase MpaB family protein n=1 Tax=uncultured Cyclobacterium sp. TaxID=453820 RepID=UPI0030EDE831|tara:strand:- start:25819 stop:26868 length:1050 start_codon:yes stop_codon:yes gene_type:complete
MNMSIDDKRLDALRLQGDLLADNLVEALLTTDQKQDLYRALRCKSWEEFNALESYEPLDDYFLNGNELPRWADKKEMDKATALFRSNGNEFLFMLGIVSLPYCYAAAKGALSLYYTEKIRKNTDARLLETTAFIVEIMKPDAFEKNGIGFLVLKQLRLRHAMARFYLKNIPAINELDELPINQEDMAGTNLAFSYMAIRAMPKIGVRIPLALANSYMHHWAVVSHLMGIEEQLLPKTMKEAFHLEKMISGRQFRPSFEGKELTKQLIRHYKENIPNIATVQLIRPLVRYMIGDKVAKTIGLKDNTICDSMGGLMGLLPLFKRFVFPPVQSFESIVKQIENRLQTLYQVN